MFPIALSCVSRGNRNLANADHRPLGLQEREGTLLSRAKRRLVFQANRKENGTPPPATLRYSPRPQKAPGSPGRGSPGANKRFLRSGEACAQGPAPRGTRHRWQGRGPARSPREEALGGPADATHRRPPAAGPRGAAPAAGRGGGRHTAGGIAQAPPRPRGTVTDNGSPPVHPPSSWRALPGKPPPITVPAGPPPASSNRSPDTHNTTASSSTAAAAPLPAPPLSPHTPAAPHRRLARAGEGRGRLPRARTPRSPTRSLAGAAGASPRRSAPRAHAPSRGGCCTGRQQPPAVLLWAGLGRPGGVSCPAPCPPQCAAAEGRVRGGGGGNGGWGCRRELGGRPGAFLGASFSGLCVWGRGRAPAGSLGEAGSGPSSDAVR